jgi:hypothetical protein
MNLFCDTVNCRHNKERRCSGPWIKQEEEELPDIKTTPIAMHCPNFQR